MDTQTTEKTTKRGRPRKLDHPLAKWIEEKFKGDRKRFAKFINVSESHLTSTISGSHGFSPEKILLINYITGIPTEDLLDPFHQIRDKIYL